MLEAENVFRDELTSVIPHMRAFARSLTNDATAADDLAQEALAKAWSARSSFTPGTNLKAWVFMILRNQFYSDKRRSWRSQPLDQEMAERTLEARDDPEATLALDDVRRAMAMLSDEHREALILIGAGGLSYEEVGEIAGCAVGTIKSRVSRARNRLAEILAGQITRDGRAPSEAMGLIIGDLERLRAGHLAA